MRRILSVILLVIGTSVAVMASEPIDDGLVVPEINAASGATAFSLVSGGLFVLRTRRKR